MRRAGGTSIAARRLAYIPTKRGAEGARRGIADALRDLVDPQVVTADSRVELRSMNAPPDRSR